MLLLLAAPSCQRESRRFQEPPVASQNGPGIEVSQLHPALAAPRPPVPNPYEDNAWALSEGQKLFDAFNCSGCHSHGGGGMGPPLLDAKWIYGSEPANIFATIVEGRPNGMPAFGGKIPEQQVWMLVSYVRALGGMARMDALPSRGDSLAGQPPLSLRSKEPPQAVPAEQP